MSVSTEKTTVAEKKTTTRKTSSSKSAASKTSAKKEATIVRKQLPLDMLVACTNLFPGTLTYKSRRQNGYEVTWEKQGDVDYIELGELVSMRNSQRAFFEKNWLGIDDEEVIEYLGVSKFYNNALSYEELTKILELPFSEMSEKIKLMPKGMRENLKIQLAQKIRDKGIDSIKVIDFLKGELGIVTD